MDRDRSPFWNEETDWERGQRLAAARERAANGVCMDGLPMGPPPKPRPPLLVLPPTLRPLSDEERAALTLDEQLERLDAANELFAAQCRRNAAVHPWKSR